MSKKKVKQKPKKHAIRGTPRDRQEQAAYGQLPPIREITDGDKVGKVTRFLQPGTRIFEMGECSIFVSPMPERYGGGWHMSISCVDRDPTWNEIVKAWYTLVPDAAYRHASLKLPPLAEYINVHSHCFNVYEDIMVMGLSEMGMEEQATGTPHPLDDLLARKGLNRLPTGLGGTIREPEEKPVIVFDELTDITPERWEEIRQSTAGPQEGD